MKKNRLDALTEKRDQINARIQTIRAKEQTQKRKTDTRRKILIGGAVLKMLKTGEMSKERISQIMNEYLENERDRTLFGLPPKKAASSETVETKK